jgi:hypothetical protein
LAIQTEIAYDKGDSARRTGSRHASLEDFHSLEMMVARDGIALEPFGWHEQRVSWRLGTSTSTTAAYWLIARRAAF